VTVSCWIDSTLIFFLKKKPNCDLQLITFALSIYTFSEELTSDLLVLFILEIYFIFDRLGWELW